MPITRTAWIDDDGTGTVGTIINNAEKTTLYNQIDALTSGLDTSQAWTPVDASGSGLVFTSVTGRHWTTGKITYFLANFIYPSNVLSGVAAKVGGLPGVSANVGPLSGAAYWAYPPFATPIFGLIRNNVSAIELFKAAGTSYSNADMSLTNHYMVGLYLRP